MKIGLIFLLAFLGNVFFVHCDDVIPWPPKEKYILQKLDHFDFLTVQRDYLTQFKQRYLYEDKWYRPGGPIFFYCGNEGDIQGFWNNTGLVFEMAPRFHALVVFGEHRYYGSSLPFGAASFQQPQISWLSIEQALADYVYMLAAIKTSVASLKAAPVVAFGGSYGGMLAAFMRFKYPTSVVGSLAASAPLAWVAGQGNFQQFFEVITADFRAVDSACPAIVRQGFAQLQLEAKAAKFATLSKQLSLCSAATSEADVQYAMRWLRNGFVMLAMMDYPYAASFMGNLPAHPVKVACNAILASRQDPVAALLRAAAVFYGKKACYKPTELYMQCSDITGCGLGPASKAWDFQACTEMNLYDRGTVSAKSMFPSMPFNLSSVTRYCTKMWEVDRAANQLRLLMWGSDVKTATNVIYSNGNLDPWSLGGILSNHSLPSSSVALLVDGGAHHLDLRSSNNADPESVRVVRIIEERYIRSWLKV